MGLKLSSIKILIVEDCIPMLDLLADSLETLGARNIRKAQDGHEGFKAFQQEYSEIVFTDWMMEPMNGIDLTREIRKSPYSPNRFVPIIMLSGYSSYKRVVTARDAGITEFLVKPFTAKNLAARIEHVINKPRDFVETADFFGPDRRRIKSPDFKGPFRRGSDADIGFA